MTSVIIGDKQLAVTRPANLDEQLVATTGCSSEEIAWMIRRVATPAVIAQALHPMLVESMPLGQLADMIAAAEPVALVASVVGMLTTLSPTPQVAPAAGEQVG